MTPFAHPAPARTVSGYRRNIAGIAVEVLAEGCLIDDDPAEELEPFAAAPTALADVHVTVKVAAVPMPPAGPPTFASEAWDLWHLAGGGYHVAFIRPPAIPRPVAVMNRESTRAVYYHAGAPIAYVDGVPVIFDPFRFPLDQLLFIQHLAFRDAFIVHAAGFAFGNDGIVVPGVSGAGKSTLTGLVAKAAPDAVALSDERIILRERNGCFEAWGTPWVGTAGIAVNAGVRARALVFLAQDTRHALSALSVPETLRRLFGVLACPWYDEERSALCSLPSSGW